MVSMHDLITIKDKLNGLSTTSELLLVISIVLLLIVLYHLFDLFVNLKKDKSFIIKKSIYILLSSIVGIISFYYAVIIYSNYLNYPIYYSKEHNLNVCEVYKYLIMYDGAFKDEYLKNCIGQKQE
jgi:hypothetical protein